MVRDAQKGPFARSLVQHNGSGRAPDQTQPDSDHEFHERRFCSFKTYADVWMACLSRN